MGLSFVLMAPLAATALQAFAAGAALYSTSIGTTFTILSTAGLSKTRLGVVLGSAADGRCYGAGNGPDYLEFRWPFNSIL